MKVQNFYCCWNRYVCNAQTEVITGPAANATVLGTKHFKQFRQLRSANTSGSVTLGFTGAGITTTGVTGSAIGYVAMVADISNKILLSPQEMQMD